MFRKDLIPMLQGAGMTVTEISAAVGQKGKTTLEDLEHLLKSLRHTEHRAAITPAQCRKCGFEFGEDKLRKPSRCPKCKGAWISEPRIRIENKN